MRFLIPLVLLLALAPAVLPAPPASAADSEVYVVPFSHLDLFWGGTREECLSRGNRIITRAIQLADRFPGFRFLIEDEVFVDNFLQSHRDSAEIERLRQLVKAGRIEIAPKWASIYQNLPRGEATVRNVVYGKRYAREVFGVDPQVAHMGDIPGFTRQYPQILARSGVPYMVMTRMGPTDRSLFRWNSPDGSSVLVWHTIEGYGWGVDLGLHRELDEAGAARVAKEVAAVQSTTLGPVYLGWGTDLWAPNDLLVTNIGVLNRRAATGHFRLATPSEYFRAAARTPAVPELAGEIPSSWSNLISSWSRIWPPTMTATDTLVNAEKFAAIGYALGYADYPGPELESLWKGTLESMDHNSYGQGGDVGDEGKVGLAQAATLRGGRILRDSLRDIAERVRHPYPVSTPIVVFNPLSWTRDDVVAAHVTLYGDVGPNHLADYRKAMRLVDASGLAIPFRVEQYSENISRALELVFIARAVPPLGYKTYYLTPADAADSFPDVCRLTLDTDNDAKDPRRVVGAHVFENEYYRVAVDRATGRIDVFDKDLGRAVVKGMEIAAAEERGGNTLSVEPQTGRTVINLIGAVEVEENSAVRTVVRVSGDVGGVPVTQRLRLYQGLKRLDVENAIEWKPGRFMKIEQLFPVPDPILDTRVGVPFGSAGSADLLSNAGPHFPDEVPREIWQGWRQVQDWVFAGAGEWGLTVSGDHQFFTVSETGVRGGMLRGTRFNPVKIVRDGRTVLLQQPTAGLYVYRYSLTSGKGDWSAARPWRSGMAFTTPLIPVSTVDELSTKSLPPERSFCSLDAENLVVSALKKGDRDGSIVVRVVEVLGAAAETPLRFLGEGRPFTTTNMLEEDLAATEEQVLRVQPYEIRTVRLNARSGGATSPRTSRAR